MISHDFIQDVCALLFLAYWRILGVKWRSWGWWHMMTLMYVKRLFWLYRNSWFITGKISHSIVITCLAPWAGKMNLILLCDWLPERARWSYLARSGLPAVSRKKNFPESHVISPLLTKFVRSRWLDISLVLFFASLWTETKSRSINTQKKKELGQYPAILTTHLATIVWAYWAVARRQFYDWGNAVAEPHLGRGGEGRVVVFVCLFFTQNKYFACSLNN